MGKSQRVLGALGGVLAVLIVLAFVIPRWPLNLSRRSWLRSPSMCVPFLRERRSLLMMKTRGSSEADLRLPVGVYTVTAQMDGYRSASRTLEVRPGTPVSVEVALLPVPLTFRLTTDVGGGKVWLDNRMVGDLNGGQITLSDVAPGNTSCDSLPKKERLPSVSKPRKQHSLWSAAPFHRRA